MTKAFFQSLHQTGPVYITDHDFAKSEREREIILFIFKPRPSFDWDFYKQFV